MTTWTFYRDYWVVLHESRRMARTRLDRVDDPAGVAAPGAGGRDWAGVEQRVGTPFPGDYKKFVDRHGAGEFAGLRVHVPDAPDPAVDFLVLVTALQDKASAYREEVRPRVAAPFFPQEGGLVPWGRNAVGWWFCWCPAGDDPDRWPVFVGDPHWSAWYQPEVSFSAFLAEYLERPVGTVSGMTYGAGEVGT